MRPSETNLFTLELYISMVIRLISRHVSGLLGVIAINPKTSGLRPSELHSRIHFTYVCPGMFGRSPTGCFRVNEILHAKYGDVFRIHGGTVPMYMRIELFSFCTRTNNTQAAF